jgi:hypothetical protein
LLLWSCCFAIVSWYCQRTHFAIVSCYCHRTTSYHFAIVNHYCQRTHFAIVSHCDTL